MVAILQTLILILGCSQVALTCHYSCATCSSDHYYECTLCSPGRGNNLLPIDGMCYCSNSYDEDDDGICESSGSYNISVKVAIWVFIGLSLLLSLATTLIKGMRYFLYKTIDDVQELSLIVFLNLYFPQQFDLFLSGLYRFNISSFTFQNLAIGSLFIVQSNASIAIVDGQNIYGKYKLLGKTANFLGNQFIWIVVAVSLLIAALIVRAVRNYLKRKQSNQTKDDEQLQNTLHLDEHISNNSIHSMAESKIIPIQKSRNDLNECSLYNFSNRIYNMVWLHFGIVFLYFSLIEININIFTQIMNLTFSSGFATVGAFLSALFLAFEFVLLALLLLQTKEEMIKPEWMRDYAFTSATYLIRTNFKTITKYFWFFSCIKKILLAVMLTAFYGSPVSAIIGVCCVHGLYLLLAIYSEPFERKYLRIHFYLTEVFKMFVFICLLDFTSEYANYVSLISLTQIFYSILAFIFALHFAFIVANLVIERDVYLHFLRKKFMAKDQNDKQSVIRVGYKAGNEYYIYEKQ